MSTLTEPHTNGHERELTACAPTAAASSRT